RRGSLADGPRIVAGKLSNDQPARGRADAAAAPLGVRLPLGVAHHIDDELYVRSQAIAPGARAVYISWLVAVSLGLGSLASGIRPSGIPRLDGDQHGRPPRQLFSRSRAS